MITYTLVCVSFVATYVFVAWVAAKLRSNQIQRRAVLLRPEERSRAEAWLVNAYSQRSSGDKAFLKAFLDEYLGNAVAAKRQAWEAAIQDPNTIRDMVADLLGKRSDEQLLEKMEENSRYLPDEAGEVDARGRLAAWRDSKMLLTPLQTRVGLAGLVILLMMILVPPWIRQEDDVTWMLWSVTSREVLSEMFVGYRPIVLARPPDEIEAISTGDLGKTRQKRKRTVVALRMLVPPLILVTACFPIAIYCLRRADDRS